jgi:hypothetical protein
MLQILGWDLILSKRVLRVILTLLSPLILWTVLLYILGFILCFVLWEFPEKWYFPFIHGNPIGIIIDRIFLLFGIVMAFNDPFKKSKL